MPLSVLNPPLKTQSVKPADSAAEQLPPVVKAITCFPALRISLLLKLTGGDSQLLPLVL